MVLEQQICLYVAKSSKFLNYLGPFCGRNLSREEGIETGLHRLWSSVLQVDFYVALKAQALGSDGDP